MITDEDRAHIRARVATLPAPDPQTIRRLRALLGFDRPLPRGAELLRAA